MVILKRRRKKPTVVLDGENKLGIPGCMMGKNIPGFPVESDAEYQQFCPLSSPKNNGLFKSLKFIETPKRSGTQQAKWLTQLRQTLTR